MSTAKRRGQVGALVVVVLLAGAQLVPVDRSNPSADAGPPASPAVTRILERSCYDCHSNRTRWPWYSRVAPMSWLVAHHVEEGRAQLNFSTWADLDANARDHKRREIVEVLRDGDMPLRSYLLIHSAAGLTREDTDTLVAWAAGGR